MGLFGTSNGQILTSMNANNQTQFKTMNNLLTLQENHVEDFFQYHGEVPPNVTKDCLCFR